MEKRLILLERSDVIEKGATSFRYQGISDEVFNQVFQIIYSEEIDNVKIQDTLARIRQQNLEVRERKEMELYRTNKGQFLEFMVIQYLKYQTQKTGAPELRELVENLPQSL